MSVGSVMSLVISPVALWVLVISICMIIFARIYVFSFPLFFSFFFFFFLLLPQMKLMLVGTSETVDQCQQLWWRQKKKEFSFLTKNFYLLILEERGRKRETFIDWSLYVPWLGTEPATLAYQDNALSNWATQPGLDLFSS